jgi:hypothetical protein
LSLSLESDMKTVRVLVAVMMLSSAVLAQFGKAVKTVSEKDGTLTVHGIAEQRDLSAYDDGGSLDCREIRPDEIKTPEVTRARVDACHRTAREFVWQHWKAKKRGYIRLTGNSVDAVSTSHFFIEPDSNGDWQIVWKIVRHNNRLDEPAVIRDVKKRETNHGFVLYFSDKNGAYYCGLLDNC